MRRAASSSWASARRGRPEHEVRQDQARAHRVPPGGRVPVLGHGEEVLVHAERPAAGAVEGRQRDDLGDGRAVARGRAVVQPSVELGPGVNPVGEEPLTRIDRPGQMGSARAQQGAVAAGSPGRAPEAVDPADEPRLADGRTRRGSREGPGGRIEDVDRRRRHAGGAPGRGVADPVDGADLDRAARPRGQRPRRITHGPRMRQGERTWMVRRPDSGSRAPVRTATRIRRRDVPATARPPGSQTRTGSVWCARARPRTGAARSSSTASARSKPGSRWPPAPRKRANTRRGPSGPPSSSRQGTPRPSGTGTAPAKSAAFASSARTAPGGPRTSTDTSGRATNRAPPSISTPAIWSSGGPGPTSTLPRAVPVAPEASVTTRTTW